MADFAYTVKAHHWVSAKAYTDRRDRAPLAFGETVADASLTATAAQAQTFAGRGLTRWVPVAAALTEVESANQQQQQQQSNKAPTSAIAGVTIVNESGTHRVALLGVFSDVDGDALTIKASSSAGSVGTAALSNDTLTVTAKSRGSATIMVTPPRCSLRRLPTCARWTPRTCCRSRFPTCSRTPTEIS